MSEWNVIHENFHTKQRAHSARWTHAIHHSVTYYEQMKQQNIWSVHMTSIGKENRSSQSLSYKEQQGRSWGGGEGVGNRKDWAELYGCIK